MTEGRPLGRIEFPCPNCEARIAAEDNSSGTVECRQCRQRVPVPAEEQPPLPEVNGTVRESAAKAFKGANELISRLVGEGAERKRIETVRDKVAQILTSEERIQYIAVQRRPVVNVAPDAVVLTNRRFIVYHQKLFGRVHFEDYVWRELNDVRLREGLLASTVYFQITDGVPITIGWVPKRHARRVYAVAQEMEERVREERRLREMEERRAAAGGVIIQGGAHPGAGGMAAADEDPVQKLKQLKEMLDAGLITPGEYEAKRQAILSRM
jgi:hypothetical protein